MKKVEKDEFTRAIEGTTKTEKGAWSIYRRKSNGKLVGAKFDGNMFLCVDYKSLAKGVS